MKATLLPKAQRHILSALSDGKLHSYRDIVLATGKYSNLPAELRERHPRSLGSKGFVRELQIKIDNETINAFQITPAGCRIIDIQPAKMVGLPQAAMEDFIKRYRHWQEQYKREEMEATSIQLRHNPYLLLKALATNGEPMTYADLARATGIFSGLPQDLRSRHARHRSLASLGLIEETVIPHETKDRYTHAFQITKAGLQLLQKVKS